MKHIFLFALFITSITLYSFDVHFEFDKNTKIDTTVVEKDTKITPISHATFVMEIKDVVIYLDPTGGAEAFKGQKEPNLILITDIHGDHLNIETLEAVTKSATTIIAPQAVADKLTDALKKQTQVISNGAHTTYKHIKIEAIPMYNLRPEALKFHAKGRGNGYLLNNNGERIYISGDTEDIPEMRHLKNIDIAFVCMNLPYTMPVKSAADAVLEFKPKEVIPYHYRGTDGLSDVDLFKSIVNTGDSKIKVTLLDWYSKN
ncbi:MBL fold metallo-hydrolase [Formosa algae]|uniref:L-ascorbate metabolism protein UlaG (Beta-lactamase superfamily) n=1 Tax=Formosa algae TaxID=225843 RepID=A0A9X1CD86_9FLAO|nr:MBL fold metallo-hydrolase [Formosa algae]MBP1841070.1 L-ascorbate metabolism protein UlaG (beta-lactamase superfamily) [Formosa algae]MDQ0336510.1 L-ascorbate metabolism protein UlaG (beta-lactamase superfamily) [Formosa algae]OEI81468.1 MBL fold metallo-hydrolase [Formosa algae]